MPAVTVLFFATFKELAGVRQAQAELAPGATVADVTRWVGERFPALQPHLSHAVTALNHEFAAPDAPILDGAELAFFPPVSGGSEFPTLYKITEEALDLDDLVAQITLPSSGAACIFTGMVRGLTTRDGPHETSYLEYEAYVPMAEAKMRQVVDEIRQRWPSVQGIAVVQRIGKLFPGTPTVLIACSAAHRDTGVFEAARYGIDRLKEIVPVWKKEVGPQGQTWVEGEYTPKPGE
jgi:molybdopterin synthase catalytic subunit